jgi:hypothetical protein
MAIVMTHDAADKRNNMPVLKPRCTLAVSALVQMRCGTGSVVFRVCNGGGLPSLCYSQLFGANDGL